MRILYQIHRLFVPTNNVVKFSDGFESVHYIGYVILLLRRHVHTAHKRRVAHDIVQLALGHNCFPVNAQGVAFDDIDIGLQRKEVQVHMDDVFRLLHHLRFGNPQGGFGWPCGNPAVGE